MKRVVTMATPAASTMRFSCEPKPSPLRSFPEFFRWRERYLSSSSSEWAKVQLAPRGHPPRSKSRHRLVLYLIPCDPWTGSDCLPAVPRFPPCDDTKSMRPRTTIRAASSADSHSAHAGADASGLGSSAASSSRLGRRFDKLWGSPVRCNAITSSCRSENISFESWSPNWLHPTGAAGPRPFHKRNQHNDIHIKSISITPLTGTSSDS